IVPKGRAGNARIADEDEQGSGEPQGEGQVKMYDQEFVSGLQAQLAAAQEREASLKLKLADAELKLTDEAIEARVKERLDFLTEVTQFTDEDVTGMTAVEAKRVALKDSLGRDYADKDDVFINMRYSIMVEEGVPERDTDLTRALRDNANNQQLGTATVEPSAAEKARQRMIDRQTARNS
ncbi:hypothetical protein ACR2VI_28150, partial [Klebsiella pneumoniae]